VTVPWYLNPLTLVRVARHTRDVLSGGGPEELRVTGVGRPKGVILPASSVSMEVKAKDGSVTRFAPELPVPWPYAWTYRLARRFGAPVVSDVDPRRVRFGVGLPR
jgi:hypothetical protein